MAGTSSLFPSTLPAGGPPRSARDLVAALYAQAGLVLACALLGGAASGLLYVRQPPVYASSAKVWVQAEQQGSPAAVPGIVGWRGAPGPGARGGRLEPEIELMLPRTNAQAVVDRLRIRDAQLAEGPLARLRAGLSGARSRTRTADLFLEGLSVQPLR